MEAVKVRWIDMDCHVAFAMLPGETNEQAEDRLLEALESRHINLISWEHEEVEESGEVPCEICQYYDVGRDDQPCCGCVDGANFEPLGGWANGTYTEG